MAQVKHPFNRSLYEAYDTPAREALVKLLKDKGHTIVKAAEDFYADIVSTKKDYTFYNEDEVKVAWEGEWPTHWAEIRIPERKKRLLAKYQDEKGVLNFYIFAKDFKRCWRIKDTLLTEDSLKEAVGRYIRKGEKFYHIPYNKAELINL